MLDASVMQQERLTTFASAGCAGEGSVGKP
jgi:hypothetical protein